MSKEFGATLKQMRQDLGLSQLEMAGQLRSTQRHISFLETGRSQPSREFVIRLATDLNLSLLQRAALFDAAGHKNPYRRRDFGDAQMSEMLDMIERRALRHWPFPGLVLDENWNVLRANQAGLQLLMPFAPSDPASGNSPLNLFEIFLSDGMQARILNWKDAAVIIYLRMHADAARSPVIADALEKARRKGLFDHIPDHLAGIEEVPPYVPLIFQGPNGHRLTMTSMVGKLTSLHEAAVEGLEIELMMPADEDTEACLLSPPPL